MYLLISTGIGREPGSPGISAPGFFDCNAVPYTADSGDNGSVLYTGQKIGISEACKPCAGGNLHHGPGDIDSPDRAVSTVPGAVVGQAVLIQAYREAGIDFISPIKSG